MGKGTRGSRREGRDGEGTGEERDKWEEVSQRVCWLTLILQ